MSPSTELTVRLGFFAGVLLLMWLGEMLFPRRRLSLRKGPRCGSNLGLVVVNSLFLRLVVPVTAVVAAGYFQAHGWGLFILISLPVSVEFILALLMFDFGIYLQHRLFHAVPLLWRFHMVHHADPDFDVTTGLRFHSFEIVISAALKLALVGLIGPSPMVVIVFEVLLNASSMFNHSNLGIPKRIDQVLRYVVVTPDMHRVHHSIDSHEANRNFGFNLPWWDRILGTYLDQPSRGHTAMEIGVRGHSNERQIARLLGMVLLPFRAQPDDGQFTRRP
ncbi:sterol desaturase family protein [Stieleria varia]|uniref:Fatty acid hydroxylase superfamily protein n=1 Tax=Stieleria varia TaxID=2528005 RepID=A0A5C6B6I6_9BACT|nr:sterol desaturase family protein [Stieleria varia]TWU06134.1 Fatty acid hydroxylase superfamily protein [Stieleria varia]